MEGLFGEKFMDINCKRNKNNQNALNYDLMKRLIIIASVLVFVSFSCRSGKDINIHVDHSKEKDQFKKPAKNKYKKPRSEW